jgi:class 3 adenylate cyclase
VALQRTFAEREGEPLRVRVGLNAGEPIRSHDLLVCQADRSFTRVL